MRLLVHDVVLAVKVQPRLLEGDEPWPACRRNLQDLGKQVIVLDQAVSVWTLTAPRLRVRLQRPVEAAVFLVRFCREDVANMFHFKSIILVARLGRGVAGNHDLGHRRLRASNSLIFA